MSENLDDEQLAAFQKQILKGRFESAAANQTKAAQLAAKKNIHEEATLSEYAAEIKSKLEQFLESRGESANGLSATLIEQVDHPITGRHTFRLDLNAASVNTNIILNDITDKLPVKEPVIVIKGETTLARSKPYNPDLRNVRYTSGNIADILEGLNDFFERNGSALRFDTEAARKYDAGHIAI